MKIETMSAILKIVPSLVFGIIISAIIPQNAYAQCNTIDFKASVTKGCPLLVVKFSAIGTSSSAGTSFQWDFGKGYVNGGDTITSFYSSSGQYTVKMQATLAGSATPCPAIIKDSFITVLPVPKPVIFSNYGFVYCGFTPGIKEVFIDSTKDEISRRWIFNGGQSIAMIDTVSFLTTGAFNVSLYATNKYGCQGYTNQIVKMLDEPAPVASWSVSNASDIYLFKVKDSSLSKSNYTWNFGDSSAQGSGYQVSHMFPQKKEYIVKLWVTNASGCVSEHDSAIDITVSGINSISNPGTYYSEIYPNPFLDKTNINFRLPQTSHVKISIMDMKGNVVFIPANKNFEQGPNHVEIDTKKAGISAGTYFMNIEIKDQVISKKIIKLR